MKTEPGTKLQYRLKGSSTVVEQTFWGINHGAQAQAFVRNAELQDVQVQELDDSSSKRWKTVSVGTADFHLMQPIEREVV